MARAAIWATRDVKDLVAETEEEGHQLHKSVGALGLTAMGVGAIIGTGIFVVIGEGAKEAGPAVILSFVLAAVTCVFSALSYAELASAVPVSGSAYTYSYATMGELVAFIIGWDLILEYGVSVAAVAVGWGGNVNEFLKAAFDWELPTAIAKSPSEGGVFNVPAVVIVLAITLLLVRGTRESARVNLVMVFIKLACWSSSSSSRSRRSSASHFTDFTPNGFHGVTSAAAIIFFAYIGFDAVSTGRRRRTTRAATCRSRSSARSSSRPSSTSWSRSRPSASPRPTSSADSDAPLAAALKEGAGITWAAAVLAFGALVAITSVVLVIMYGQTRIFFAMCRDGLMPTSFAKVNQRYGTPARLTIGFGVLIASWPRSCRWARSSSWSTSARSSPSSWSTSG